MHTLDRYALALEMLAGDGSARQVLADLLEEQGDRGLAQWARQGRNTKPRMLDFAVTLLGCRPAIGLATEFLKASETSLQRRLAGTRLLLATQGWASRKIGDAEALATCQREAAQCLEERRNPYVRIDDHERSFASTGANQLIEAIDLTVQAEALSAKHQRREAIGRENDARLRVRQLVRLTAARTFPPLMAPDGSVRYLKSVEWQIERTRRLFADLLKLQVDAWPR